MRTRSPKQDRGHSGGWLRSVSEVIWFPVLQSVHTTAHCLRSKSTQRPYWRVTLATCTTKKLMAIKMFITVTLNSLTSQHRHDDTKDSHYFMPVMMLMCLYFKKNELCISSSLRAQTERTPALLRLTEIIIIIMFQHSSEVNTGIHVPCAHYWWC